MKKLATALIAAMSALCMSESACANELLQVRATVQSDKTRIVFDFSSKPQFSLSAGDKFSPVIEFDNVATKASLPLPPGKKFGPVIQTVSASRDGDSVVYSFSLNYDVQPRIGQLPPTGNYKNYRVYMDISNADLARHEKKGDAAAKIAAAPKEDKASGLRSLTPAEAAKLKEAQSENNRLALEKSMSSSGKKPQEQSGSGNKKVSANPDDSKKSDSGERQGIWYADDKSSGKGETAQAKPVPAKGADKQNGAGVKAQDKPSGKPDKAAQTAKTPAEQEKNDRQSKPTQQGERGGVDPSTALKPLPGVKTPGGSGKDSKKEPAKAASGDSKKQQTPAKQCKRRVVVIAIDAGHGGKDPGAIGPGKTSEKSVTLGIAKHLRKILADAPGLKPVMTRSGDVFIDLNRRSEIARKNNADFLISIHADAALNPDARGASVLVLNNDRAGRENRKMQHSTDKHDSLLSGAGEVLEETAANGEGNIYMQSMIIELTSGKSRDAGYDLANRIIKNLSGFARMHKAKPDERSLAVLKAPDIPSILIETGFVSNKEEEKLLKSDAYQKKIASAVYRALKSHLENPKYQIGERCD